MTDNVEVRTSVSGDLPAIEALYPDAFPDEELLPLVRDLLREVPKPLSLVATINTNLVGHVMFTRCGIAGSCSRVALLGPLAVASAWQRRSCGSALVRDGLKQLEHDGTTHVYVLGDPAYYRRFGFMPESHVLPPYPLPEEWRSAWQSIGLGGSSAQVSGKLSLPRTWLQPSLWAPP